MKKLTVILIIMVFIFLLFGVLWYSFYLHGITKENDTFSSGILSLTGNILTAIVTAYFSLKIYQATKATNEATEATNKLTKQIHEENHKVVLKAKIEDNHVYRIENNLFNLPLNIYNLGNANTCIESIEIYSPSSFKTEWDKGYHLMDVLVNIYDIKILPDEKKLDSLSTIILPARTVISFKIEFCPYNYNVNNNFPLKIHIKDIFGNEEFIEFMYYNPFNYEILGGT